ncbi:MAG TPA: hypothetical protein VF914_21055 [Chloroflexia bacterium]|jgi:hypothetical protein
MKRLAFNKRHNLGQLYEELLETIPALRPQVDTSGIPIASLLMEESTSSAWLWLSVPDDVNEADVAAVVARHDPTSSEQKRIAREATKEKVRRLAEKAVGKVVDQLTPTDITALYLWRLFNVRALTDEGVVRPLDEWAK